MEFIKTFELSKSQKLDILELWNNEYPKKLGHNNTAEFDKYLDTLSEKSYILLLDTSQKVIGWYVDFKRDDEKWFAVILDSKQQGKGYGTKLLNMAKEKEIVLNGWVIDHNNDKKRNGEIYKSPLNFYLKNGFELINNQRLELDKISAVKITWTKENNR